MAACHQASAGKQSMKPRTRSPLQGQATRTWSTAWSEASVNTTSDTMRPASGLASAREVSASSRRCGGFGAGADPGCVAAFADVTLAACATLCSARESTVGAAASLSPLSARGRASVSSFGVGGAVHALSACLACSASLWRCTQGETRSMAFTWRANHRYLHLSQS